MLRACFLQSARAALVAALSFVTDDSNVNLTAHQKILLWLHYRLGHVGFNVIRSLAHQGVFGEVAQKAVSAPVPKCHACQLMKAISSHVLQANSDCCMGMASAYC